ncbi:NACHT domain-containing protein [Streptomyces phaeofaciens]|uniref:NACHT domain-containing protein n=1 Tax=Streptomyces phaeofaciens TaxID=68254 RepID=UPI003688042E
MPSLYLAWAAIRHPAKALNDDLQTAATSLARTVKNQWDEETRIRRLNDPYPLPVAWRPADDDLAEPWPLLTERPHSWPGGPPGAPALWPPAANGLSGADAQIAEVSIDRVPTRRMVILGEPGAGKSMLLIRLLLDLIERRTPGSPVPVLFSLASWDPRQQLKSWLSEELRRTYPELRAPVPITTAAADATARGDMAQALLDAGHILPLLDGFDELPPAWHTTALDALNRGLPAPQSLVLSSRTCFYRTAVSHQDGMVRLNGGAAIQLLPLAPDAASNYLRRDAGGPQAPAADRWDTVIAHLGTDTPVGQALSTPLGLFLARTIYNPRPQAGPGPAPPHPDELCDTTAYPDRTAVDTHLFQAFIPAAYTPAQPRPPRWTAEQAHHTFVFLARFLRDQREGNPDLAWWEIPRLLPARTRLLTGGAVFGILFGIAFGIISENILGIQLGGILFGVFCGLIVGARGATALRAPAFAGRPPGHRKCSCPRPSSELRPGFWPTIRSAAHSGSWWGSWSGLRSESCSPSRSGSGQRDLA